MAVTYQTEGVKMPDIKKRETTEWIKAVAASYGKRLGEIAYIFCSDEKILEMSASICNMTTTRILLLSIIVKAIVYQATYSLAWTRYAPIAEQFGASYEDELHRVIIHGILHLCGINDKEVPENGKLWKLRRIKH